MFPWFLFRAVREAEVTREIEPYVGYVDLTAGGCGDTGRVILDVRTAADAGNAGVVLAGAGGVFFHFRRVVSDREPQTRGESGVGFSRVGERRLHFWRGSGAAHPLLVEAGVLLDVFVAVFVMGITIFHINREFDHIDTDRLSTLKD